MRLWSLHPTYLDRLELLACWCEGLRVLKILREEPLESKRYPHLQKFRDSGYAVDYMLLYLWFIYKESESRGYNLDKTKLGLSVDEQIFFAKYESNKLSVTIGQLEFEFNHLYKKLLTRDENKAKININSITNENSAIDTTKIKSHQIFQIVDGSIEKWEKIL